MSSKIKVDTIENVAGSGNVSLGSGHNLVVPGTLNITGASTLTGGIANAGTITAGTLGSSVVFPAGCVIQTVNTSWTTKSTISSQTATAITGASLAITPKFSTSKILVMINLTTRIADSNTTYYNTGFEILRGSTQLQQLPADGTGPFEVGHYDAGHSGGELCVRYVNNIVDSPSTTSATTYSVKGKVYGSAGGVLTINAGTSTTGQSSIILMEIAQ